MTRPPVPSIDPLESRALMSTVAVAVPDVLTPASVSLTALGQLNADARVDQAFLRRLPSLTGSVIEVTLSAGVGNGTFAKSDAAVVNGYTASAVTVGDLNNDGKADVVFIGTPVVPPASPAAPKVYAVAVLGNGQGKFLRNPTTQAPVILRVGIPKLENAASLAVGDFNGDGLNDVAGLGKSLFQATTTSLPVPRTTIAVAWGVPPMLPVILPPTVVVPVGNPAVDALFAGDVDGDKKADLVAAKRHATPLVPTGPTTTAVVPPPDLVTVRFPTTDRQKPAVSVSANPLYRLPPIVSPITSLAAPTITWRDMETFGLADLDGNGTAELVGRRGSTLLFSSWLTTSTTGAFAPAVVLPSYGALPDLTFSHTLLGDIDGDKRTDLLSSTPTAGRYVGRNVLTNVGKPAIAWSRVPISVITVAAVARPS